MFRAGLIPIIIVIMSLSSAKASPIAQSVMEALSADDMQGRKAGTEGGLKAGNYIISQAEHLGLKTEVQSFMTSRGGEGRNLIVKLQGMNDVSNSVLIVSAHYDHIGMRDEIVNNGADDNASGVGALFAMIEDFKIKPPENDIWFIFFDEEEGGINGSNWFVQQNPNVMSRPMVNVNFDMIGRPKDGAVEVTGGLLNPSLGKVVTSVPIGEKLTVNFVGDGPEYGTATNARSSSDHKPFDARNVPFLFVHTGTHDDYHQPTDDATNINPEDYAAIVAWSFLLVESIDKNLSALAKIPS